MTLFQQPKFIKSAVLESDYPKLLDAKGHPLLEVAVVGRSNVGKSSLLNHLFKTRALVKTSSTPGKTQMLNFFSLNNQLAFVDVPGYGWAKTNREERQKQADMIEQYLMTRTSLKLLLFLLDIRRIPNQDDLQMLEWIAFQKLSTLFILTKVDKVNQAELYQQTQKLTDTIKPFPHIHYSVVKNRGRQQLITQINKALYDPS